MVRQRKFPDAAAVKAKPAKRPTRAQHYPGPRPARPRQTGKAGRQPIFREEWVPIILELCGKGWLDAEIARLLGVRPDLLSQWRYQKPELKKSMDHWRAFADERVERALYERAIGYTFASEEIKVIKDEVVHVPTVVHMPPDTKAIETWLFNRRSGVWRNRQEVIVRDAEDVNTLTTEELMRIAASGPKLINGTTNGSKPH